MKKPARAAVSAATQKLLDEMGADAARPPSADKLEACRVKLTRLRELEFENIGLAERQTNNSAEMRVIREKDLVELFDAAGIESLGLPPLGNLPAYEVDLGEFFHANIPEEKKSEAWAWMKRTKNEDLVKTEFKVTFGLKEAAKAKKFEVALKKLVGSAYDRKQSVPWNTLTSFVKKEFEAGRPLTKTVMAILGASSGRVAKVVKQEKK